MDIKLTHKGVTVKVLDGPYISQGKPTEAAVAYYSDLVERMHEFRRYAAQNLLDRYNEIWITEEIGRLDEQQFMSRLSDPALHLYDEIGAAVVYFTDGGLFGGHFVEVSIDNGVPVFAEVAG